jgi:hypothetical protein
MLGAAPSLKVRWRGDEDAPRLGEAPDGDVAVRFVLTGADGDIDAVVDQVEVSVGGLDVNSHFGYRST